ncbi:MAG: IclR family transcriptional regulator C-terminal domain-containing protein [Granulosicoccus sp.]
MNGSRVPAFVTVEGKMYLSLLCEQWLKRIIDNMRLERYTSNMLVSHDALRKDLEDTTSKSYALYNDEYIDGVVALAVPVYNYLGRFYATLSFHTTSMRLRFGKISCFLPRLQTASQQLSELPED